mgnify:CR=1 FL=1
MNFLDSASHLLCLVQLWYSCGRPRVSLQQVRGRVRGGRAGRLRERRAGGVVRSHDGPVILGVGVIRGVVNRVVRGVIRRRC